MKMGPDIARVAALLGDPARANMLTALMGGQSLTAGELAREAGVSAQTASSHLAKLEAGALVIRRKQGRHGYFSLADADVAEVVEQLMTLAERTGARRVRTGPKDPALRRARVCYDHLAGDLGVALLDGLKARDWVVDSGDDLALTPAGRTFAETFGVDLSGRRAACKACLDWSVRRSHLAGAMGAGLLDRFYGLKWATRLPESRIVQFSPDGLKAFGETFGINLAEA